MNHREQNIAYQKETNQEEADEINWDTIVHMEMMVKWFSEPNWSNIC